MLDELDLEILLQLQKDGRLSHAAIGKEIGMTGPSVYARIKRMEQEGVIEGYTVVLNPAKLERGLVAFVRVMTSTGLEGDGAFEEFARKEPLIMECHDVDGEDSYILKVRTSSTQSLRVLLSRIRGFPAVSRTITSIVLQSIKEPPTGNLLEETKVERNKDVN
ncbi:MAG: Lrp/AsnC family transcriptional regulator [Chloroflexi bacterium]|nr:Lrp/AsnC family transcriptional regulator [Chloroflexota bacterium]